MRTVQLLLLLHSSILIEFRVHFPQASFASSRRCTPGSKLLPALHKYLYNVYTIPGGGGGGGIIIKKPYISCNNFLLPHYKTIAVLSWVLALMKPYETMQGTHIKEPEDMVLVLSIFSETYAMSILRIIVPGII